MNTAGALAALGFGGAKLILHLPGPDHPRGSRVEGSVQVIGGRVVQRAGALIVTLKEFSNSGKNEQTVERQQLVLSTDFTVSPFEDRSFPFSLDIPDDAKLTNEAQSAGMFVQARAWIPMSYDPRAKKNLNVVIHREITAIHAAIESMGFHRSGWQFQLTRGDLPEMVNRYFKSPVAMQKHLDGVSLRLRATEKSIVGRLVVNRHERNIAEHVRSLIDGRREEYEIEIPRADLLGADGAPDQSIARVVLRQTLDSALDAIRGEQTTLLRPAERPAEDDTLLRPAQGDGQEIHAERLLRPAGKERA